MGRILSCPCLYIAAGVCPLPRSHTAVVNASRRKFASMTGLKEAHLRYGGTRGFFPPVTRRLFFC